MDTGADVTVINYRTFEKLGIELVKPTRLLTSANGRELGVYGEVEVKIMSKRASTTTRVSVMKGAKRNLLGVGQIRSLGLIAIIDAVCARSFDPLTEFPTLFEGLGTLPGTFEINLEEGTKPLHLYSPRVIAAGLCDKAKAEIESMLAKGVIEPMEQPTDWCSGLTIAPKANGGIRMCVDLTTLNKGVKRETYPLPRVSVMLATLSAGRVFSKLDANSGFWQVKLHPDSRRLTTFITPWGRYCFKRMPFGISSAPEFFQCAMEKILAGLPGVVCLMDDVLVFGRDENEH